MLGINALTYRPDKNSQKYGLTAKVKSGSSSAVAGATVRQLMAAFAARWRDGKNMQWKIERHLILWGFVAAATILLFVGWESYQNTTRFAEAAGLQKHTYEVLRTLDETVAVVVDAETSQRGYLLTGNKTYLEPYRAAIKIRSNGG